MSKFQLNLGLKAFFPLVGFIVAFFLKHLNFSFSLLEPLTGATA